MSDGEAAEEEGPPPAATVSVRGLRDLSTPARVSAATMLGVLVVGSAVVVDRMLRAGYTPVGDEAVIAARATDAIANRELVGQVTSAWAFGGPNSFQPGPIHLYVVWPFAQLFGVAAGMLISTVFVNVAALGLVAWATHRAYGPVAGWTAVTAAVVMVDLAMPGRFATPLNVNVPVLPMFAAFVVAWLVVRGDTAVLALLVVLVTFTLQTDLVYGLLPLIAAVTATVAVIRSILRGEAPSRWRRDAAVAGAVGVVLWALPMYDQLFGRGNLWTLATSRIPGEGRSGASRALGSILNPGRARLERAEVDPATMEPLAWGALLTIAIGVWVVARRWPLARGRPELLWVAGAVVLGTAVQGFVGPVDDPFPWHFYWVRAVTVFALLSVGLAVAPRAERDRPRWARVVDPVLGVVVFSLLAAPLWTPLPPSREEAAARARVESLVPQLDDSLGSGSFVLREACPCALLAVDLQARLPERDIRLLTPAQNPPPDLPELVIRFAGPAVSDLDGEVVARHEPPGAAGAEQAAGRVAAHVARQGGLELTPQGVRSVLFWTSAENPGGDLYLEPFGVTWSELFGLPGLPGPTEDVTDEAAIAAATRVAERWPELITSLYVTGEISSPVLPEPRRRDVETWYADQRVVVSLR